MGCWTPRETFSHRGAADWQARVKAPDGSRFDVLRGGAAVGTVSWPLIGLHNVDNALAAIAAACHAGADAAAATEALGRFRGVRRRMELRGVAAGVAVYDDFAHHPTAIATTLAGLRGRVDGARIVAVLEPRSNTMRMGVHRDRLADALGPADLTVLYAPEGLGWDPGAALAPLGERARVFDSVDAIVAFLGVTARPRDHLVVMSNGAFGGIHGKLLAALGARA
jgi:UDP-N-acetylmuramate: L-alanyl-gamma-D-glutamyl-meso-diaminopimelate ligase